MIGSVDIFVDEENRIEIELCEGDIIGGKTLYWLVIHLDEISVYFHLNGENGKDKFLEEIKRAIENPPIVK